MNLNYSIKLPWQYVIDFLKFCNADQIEWWTNDQVPVCRKIHNQRNVTELMLVPITVSKWLHWVHFVVDNHTKLLTTISLVSGGPTQPEAETRKFQQVYCSRIVASQSCIKPRYHIRMRSHRLLRLHDNKFSTGLTQVDCQDFLSTTLMQVVSATYSKSANIMQVGSCLIFTDLMHATWWSQQKNWHQVCGVLAVYSIYSVASCTRNECHRVHIS